MMVLTVAAGGLGQLTNANIQDSITPAERQLETKKAQTSGLGRTTQLQLYENMYGITLWLYTPR
jgi:hypothetical protein